MSERLKRLTGTAFRRSDVSDSSDVQTSVLQRPSTKRPTRCYTWHWASQTLLSSSLCHVCLTLPPVSYRPPSSTPPFAVKLTPNFWAVGGGHLPWASTGGWYIGDHQTLVRVLRTRCSCILSTFHLDCVALGIQQRPHEITAPLDPVLG